MGGFVFVDDTGMIKKYGYVVTCCMGRLLGNKKKERRESWRIFACKMDLENRRSMR
jgi:hypothetical protein